MTIKIHIGIQKRIPRYNQYRKNDFQKEFLDIHNENEATTQLI